MLSLRDGQATVWEELLPEQMRLLSPELGKVDALLDDERFLRPFVALRAFTWVVERGRGRRRG